MYLPDPTWSKQVCLVSSVISQHGVPPRGIVPHGFRWFLSLKRLLAMREVSLVPYKQPRSSSPNRCGIIASLEPPKRGAWLEHMTRSHKRHQLMMRVHIRNMVGPPQGIVPHGFQWILSLKRRLAMREVFLVSYKQSRPLSPNRCGIMASSEPPG